MKVRIALLTALFAVGLFSSLSLRVPEQSVVRAQANSNARATQVVRKEAAAVAETSSCPTIDVPAVTVGANDDVYLLDDPLRLSLVNAAGDASFFSANDLTFSGHATLQGIARRGGSAKGITISSANSKATALSCRESFWDINFMLAGMGAAAGDKIRLFMQPDDSGSRAFDLARFEIATNSGGANLTYLEPTSTLFANGHVQQRVGAFLPYVIGAGQSGRSTEQIVIALSMDKKAPTMACLHLGVEIIRASGTGKTSIVFNTMVLSRSSATSATGVGLFSGRPGLYPTKPECDQACPTCGGCVRAEIPATTIGDRDDQYLLPKPLQLTLTDAQGEASFFATNDINFGGNATLGRIVQAGRAGQGLRVAGVGSSASALTCRDHFWDINFMLAGLGATAGDSIRLFMQQNDSGKGAIELARFEVARGGNGVNLTYLEPTAQLFANGHVQQRVNSFLPYSFNASGSGMRTDQIVIVLSMNKNAPTAGCQHLGVEIIKDGGAGASTIVFNSLVLVRDGATKTNGTGLFTGLTGAYPTKEECDGACPSCCPAANVPATAVGSTGSIEDQFLLSDPLKLTLLDGTGNGAFFATNDANFGGNATLGRIAAAGGRAQGLGISTPNGKALAVSCRESFWDINFMLAGLGATTGDRVRLYLQPDETGNRAFDLARFTVGAGGVTLNYLEPTSQLFANGHVQQNTGAFIPFIFAAGSSGKRTDQMVIVLSMDPKAPTMKCLHLAVEITRDSGAGTTALVFNTIVLSRSGPLNGAGTGLFTGLQGRYPTRTDCDASCPICDK